MFQCTVDYFSQVLRIQFHILSPHKDYAITCVRKRDLVRMRVLVIRKTSIFAQYSKAQPSSHSRTLRQGGDCPQNALGRFA